MKIPKPETLAPLMEKLSRLAKQAKASARRSMNAVRNAVLTGVLVAVWLAYGLMWYFKLSPLQTLPIFLVLALPAFLFGILYWILQDILTIPIRLGEAVGNIKSKSMETWQGANELKSKLASPDEKPKFSDWISLGKAMLDLKDHGRDVTGIIATLRETLLP